MKIRLEGDDALLFRIVEELLPDVPREDIAKRALSHGTKSNKPRVPGLDLSPETEPVELTFSEGIEGNPNTIRDQLVEGLQATLKRPPKANLQPTLNLWGGAIYAIPVVFRAWRHHPTTGVKMYAADYGYRAWPIRAQPGEKVEGYL